MPGGGGLVANPHQVVGEVLVSGVGDDEVLDIGVELFPQGRERLGASFGCAGNLAEGDFQGLSVFLRILRQQIVLDHFASGLAEFSRVLPENVGELRDGRFVVVGGLLSFRLRVE